MKYHVQLKCIDYRQVEIESEGELTHRQIMDAAIKKVQSELGESDEIRVTSVERIAA